MTHHVLSPSGEFTVILPGTWAAIPMDDAEAMRKRVAAVIKKQMPREDRLARARQIIREDLLRTATEASRLGANLFSIALEMLPGVPFAASLISFTQDWPPTATSGDAEARLKEAFPDGLIVPCENSLVIRRSSQREQEVGDTTFPALDLEYWFASPSGKLLSFLVSVPMCEHVELFTAFFDSVADSVRWATAVDAPSAHVLDAANG